MKLLFRCDAGHQIGLGHLMRCLTLANAWREHGARSMFVCRQHPGLPGELVRQADHKLIVLPEASGRDDGDLAHSAWLGCSQLEDAEQTLSCLKAPVDWIITDHYALDQRWHKVLRAQCRHLLAIDDLADRPHDCDALLDQNLGRKAEDYETLVPAHCQRLVGLDFSLLRPEFAAWRERSLQRERRAPVKRLMISLGGIDQHNMSGQILKALHDNALIKDCHVEVILGSSAPHQEALQAQIKALPGNITLAVGINNMAERLASTDLVIGAAGSSAWERCSLGVPSLMVVLADNQKPLAEALSQNGAAIAIKSDSPDKFSAHLGQAFEMASQQLHAMQNAASALLDGRGAQRVVERMLAL